MLYHINNYKLHECFAVRVQSLVCSLEAAYHVIWQISFSILVGLFFYNLSSSHFGKKQQVLAVVTVRCINAISHAIDVYLVLQHKFIFIFIFKGFGANSKVTKLRIMELSPHPSI